ncbi:MAG: Uma2 family endonuclease [Thermosynechococcaceae cyanobacterium]
MHPKLIIEVLSDTTEAFDRGDKFTDYKAIAELEEYVLVHQRQRLVEQFRRQFNTLWVPDVYRDGDMLEFASIGLSCSVADLYENIAQLQQWRTARHPCGSDAEGSIKSCGSLWIVSL